MGNTVVALKHGAEHAAPKITRAPISLFVSITSRCNLSCRHCSVYGDTVSYGSDLTTSQWCSFIDHIADIKVFRIKISGGEPLMREDIFTILDHLAEKPIRFSLNTNAALIDEAAARRLASYNDSLSDIMVSIDGGVAEVHDALRGDGAFAGMAEGLGRLTKRYPRVSAYCTVTRLNVGRLEEVIRFAEQFGIRAVKFNDLVVMGRGKKYRDTLILSAKERRRTIDELLAMKKDHPAISGTFIEVEDIFESIRSAGIQPGDESAINFLSGCGALLKDFAIRPDGLAVPCDRLPEIVAENILNTPIDVIWRQSPVFARFRERFTTPITDLATCSKCRYAPHCTGGCAAAAYAAYGTTLARDPSCCLRLFEEEASDARP